MAECVECGAAVNVPQGAMKGEIIDCPECGVELEIVNPQTQELRLAEVAGEDWGQ